VDGHETVNHSTGTSIHCKVISDLKWYVYNHNHNHKQAVLALCPFWNRSVCRIVKLVECVFIIGVAAAGPARGWQSFLSHTQRNVQILRWNNIYT